jgi:hypothetical protein
MISSLIFILVLQCASNAQPPLPRMLIIFPSNLVCVTIDTFAWR